MFPDGSSRQNTVSALERLGLAADGRDTLISPLMMAAAGLRGGLVPPAAASSLPLAYQQHRNSLLAQGVTSQRRKSEILAALVGHRQDALREAMLARSLPFSNPLEALNAATAPQVSLTGSYLQDALVNEVFQRGREEALMNLLHSGALGTSFLPRTPAPLHPSAVGTEQLVQHQTALSARDETTISLETLGNSGVDRRNANAPYFDASKLKDPDPTLVTNRRTRGGVTEPFPEKLHRMLRDAEEAGEADVVSFFPHGRAFAIHHVERFCREVMPRYFNQSRLSSFQRQLNLYGFTRISTGPDSGGYYHELFLKGRPALAIHMRRVGVPKPAGVTRGPRISNPSSSPDFYSMAPVTTSDDDCKVESNE